MKIKRFEGKNVSEAMRSVKKEFGKDAVIVSTENIKGKVYITAARDYDLKDEPVRERRVQPKGRSFQERAYGAGVAEVAVQPEPKMEPLGNLHTSIELDSLRDELRKEREKSNKREDFFLRELSMLRESLAKLLSETVSRDSSLPVTYTPYIKAGIECGVDEDLIVSVLERHGIDDEELFLGEEKALSFLLSAFSDVLSTSDIYTKIDREGGVFAYVGPTGVGKTTTLVKTAASLVMKEERTDLCLVSLDFMRADGSAQLKRFSNILGLPFFTFGDGDSYLAKIDELRKNYKTVLVDTAGVSPLNRSSLEFLEKVAGNQYTSSILHIPVATEYEQARSVFDIFRERLGDVVLAYTKEDEAVRNGLIASLSVLRKADVAFVTNGQRIPEDILCMGDSRTLAELVFKRKYENL